MTGKVWLTRRLPSSTDKRTMAVISLGDFLKAILCLGHLPPRACKRGDLWGRLPGYWDFNSWYAGDAWLHEEMNPPVNPTPAMSTWTIHFACSPVFVFWFIQSNKPKIRVDKSLSRLCKMVRYTFEETVCRGILFPLSHVVKMKLQV